MSLSRVLACVGLGAAALAGLSECASPGVDPGEGAAVSPQTLFPAGDPQKPLIPRDDGDFYPSQIAVAAGARGRGAELADVDRCAPCHADAVYAWRGSIHALGSFSDPIYRVAVDGFRKTIGKKESLFCAGCHDIALLVDGAMDREIEPNDPRAHAGISCGVCHGIVDTRAGGNAAYTLGDDAIPIPDMDDEASIAAHKKAAAPAPLRTPALCSSCHKAFLDRGTKHPHFISGQDDALPFRRSAYAGSNAERIDVMTGSEPAEDVPRETCQSCHMPRVATSFGDVSAKKGLIASHAFASSHTALFAMAGDDAQVMRAEQSLEGAASIDVAAVRHLDGSEDAPAETGAVVPGEHVELDVVVRNTGVGHFFPGGTLDLQDAWIEVTVRDASGQVLAAAGDTQEATGVDPSAHRLRAEIVDEDARPVLGHEVERFRTVVYNQAVGARDAVVVGYALDVPEKVALPVQVTAVLRHRARQLPALDGACRDLATDRGKAFAEVTGIDPCVDAPVVTVAEKSVKLSGVSVDPTAVTFDRLADHARGWLHAAQEKTGAASSSLEVARTIAESLHDTRRQAIAWSLLGELASKQGRADEALALFDRAEGFAPGHPALAMGRGRALAQVWRFPEAVPYFEAAARGAPLDESALVMLAQSRASSGDPEGALGAAQAGLKLTPRQPDLLRSQSLALRALLGDADPGFDRTNRAQLQHRPADVAPRLRAECGLHVPGCALEREPVHVHALHPVR